MSSILSEVVDDEIIRDNPALRTGKHIRKEDQTRTINPLSREEKAKLEDTVKQHFPKWYPFVLKALRSGMGLGELIGLQQGDLDFNGGFIEIRRSVTRRKVTTTKSGKVRRVDVSKELSGLSALISIGLPFCLDLY